VISHEPLSSFDASQFCSHFLLQFSGLFCGSLGKDYEKIYDCGIQSLLTTVDGCIPLSEAMERAEELYYRGAVRLFRFFL
jgi:hypothetical protein